MSIFDKTHGYHKEWVLMSGFFRDRFWIKRGQRGYFAITHGVGEHGSRFPQCRHWKTRVDYKGHRYAV